jgi:flagellar biogenesis protein FliO
MSSVEPGVERMPMFRRALKLAFSACLLIAALTRPGAATERTPQIIPPPVSDRVQPKDTKASSTIKGQPSKGSLSKSSNTNWGTTLGGLTAVLALIYLSARVLRKSMPAAQRTLPVEVIQVLGRKPLDYRHSIHLIRCGSKLLVVGSSQEGLTTLCEMTDPVEIDYLAGLCKPSEPTSVADSFNQLFRRFQGPGSTPSAVEVDPQSNVDPASRRLQERLQMPARNEADDLNEDEPHGDQTRESAA